MTQELPASILSARAQWRWRGQGRPPFALAPGPGQTSVWDFPRPPRLVPDTREVVVRWGTREVARTRRAVQVQETAHPPTYYLPWDDVVPHLLQPASGSAFCEWKGPSRNWTLVDGERRLASVAWSYPQPMAGAEMLASCVAFYAAELDCRVGAAVVTPQSGGFYGGWITSDLAGPFKGEPGSAHW